MKKRSLLRPRVGILMGSDSDLEVMRETEKRLDYFGIPYEIRILSAQYAASAPKRGLEVVIVGAGAAAHLAGVVAAKTTLPVIGVPIDSSSLRGMDALLSTVQMPAGVPVATMAIGRAGAANAAIFAAEILARKDTQISTKLTQLKEEMASGVEEKDSKLRRKRQNR
ncbi:MAG: 5-(carboxyamino)imidazole ribonucleotide mutase [Candidatus Binatia bacterium]